MYCILRLTTQGDETKPDLPEGVGFCDLASPADELELDFGLYRTAYINEEELLARGGRKLSDSLTLLLNCAASYPPAMAMTSQIIRGDTSVDSVETFLSRYEELLTKALENQAQDNFFLARDLTGIADSFDRPGGFYWILGWHEKSDSVQVLDPSWGDFCSYRFERKHFDLSRSRLEPLRIEDPEPSEQNP